MIEAYWISVDLGLTSFRVFFYLFIGFLGSLILALISGVLIMIFSELLFLLDPESGVARSLKHRILITFGVWVFFTLVACVIALTDISRGTNLMSNTLLTVGFNSELLILQLSQVALLIAVIIFSIGILLLYRRRGMLSEIKAKILS